MRYASTILYVSDTAAAVEFYGRAFGLEPGFTSPDASYATLGGESSGLAFATHEMAPQVSGTREAPAGFEVWLETDDVPAAYSRAVEAGAEAVAEPVEKPWGQTVAYVRDLNGTLVELGEPVPDA